MSDNNQVTLTIDGLQCTAAPGAMLIEVADEAGIYIPRFCYHEKLSIAANCRMCLVEVEKSPKPLPACATPVADGMVVSTNSARAKSAQNNVLEFLLINHPLDCPICDQGGECELQDLAMGYGRDSSAFVEGKRVVADKNIGPLIGTEMTRCIHCTRCVRFGEEIVGLRELGMTGRGMHAEIGTYIEKSIDHELSGNVIDLCPVGALTAKPSRYNARAWELRQTESVAPHDAVGSNIYLHSMRDKLVRVAPRDNEAINEVWISDRDRFSYQGVLHQERVASPMIKTEGEWVETDWQTAIDAVIEGIKPIIEAQGAQQLGAWVSPQATLEEMFLLQGIVRHLGSHNIDHRLLQTDFRRQSYEASMPTLGMAINDIDKQDCIMIVGANIRKEQPIIAHRIRKAALAGATVSTLNPRIFDLRMDVLHNLCAHPSMMANELAAIAAALGADAQAVKPIILGANPTKAHEAIAHSLRCARHGLIVLGQIAVQHVDYAVLSELSMAIADAADVKIVVLPAAANTVGAWQMGILPHRLAGGFDNTQVGKNIAEMLSAPPAALLLHNVEPQHDCADPRLALRAVDSAEFVVSVTPYANEQVKNYSHVILPMTPYPETDGTFINMEGLAQSFSAAVKPYAKSSPAWKIYRVLGEQLGIENYRYETAAAVLADALQTGRSGTAASAATQPLSLQLKSQGLIRSGEMSIHATDSLVRRASALQASADGKSRRVAVMNGATAEKVGLNGADCVLVTQGDAVVELNLTIDNDVADDTLWAPLIPELGALNTEVQVKAVSHE